MTADDLHPDWRQAYEERAAILEFDAGLPRRQAELEALRMTTAERQARETRPAP